jgi:hypothetical protein
VKEYTVTKVVKSGFKPLTTKEMRSSSSTGSLIAASSSANYFASFRYLVQVLLLCCKLYNCCLRWETRDFDSEAYLAAREVHAWCNVSRPYTEDTKDGLREQMI